jgi:hypothetical protein
VRGGDLLGGLGAAAEVELGHHIKQTVVQFETLAGGLILLRAFNASPIVSDVSS